MTQNWQTLFPISMELIEKTKEKFGLDVLPYISFGGGTALRQYINHRISDDVDLFIDDPQLLGYLNPFQQDFKLSKSPDNYEIDSYCFLKINYENIGEIDFICSGIMTQTPYEKASVLGYEINMETPAEIIAKKIFYRGSNMVIRDVFDIAAVVKTYGASYLSEHLSDMKSECQVALDNISKWDKDDRKKKIDELRTIGEFGNLKKDALEITKEFLSQVTAPQSKPSTPEL